VRVVQYHRRGCPLNQSFLRTVFLLLALLTSAALRADFRDFSHDETKAQGDAAGSGFQRINATNDMEKWTQEFRGKLKLIKGGLHSDLAYSECREVEEISEAFLCQWGGMPEMNRAMIRATMFVEGTAGHKAGTIPGQSDFLTARAARMIVGHDLRGQDLKKFYDMAVKACETDKDKCLNESEKQFFDKIMPQIKRTEGKIVVITYAADGPMHPREVVSHEIMHAQYFLQPRYQQVADKLWKEVVTETDKTLAKQYLADAYDVTDDFLVRNEFQAYMLMSGAEDNLLGALAGRYRDRLFDAMEEAKVKPIQVKW
jgi:hypothetical protein